MISMEELLSGNLWKDLPDHHQENLDILLIIINRIRFLYGKPMNVTSGYRSLKHHKEIYAKKGITDESKIPMKSKHLEGAACDIYDPKKELQDWCVENEKELELTELWCEDFGYTPNWVHFQIFPPRSGDRFFKP